MTQISLALGGGSAKGLAHIGVLKVFDKHHIKISHISGSSIGALIGGLYCSGITPEEMEELALTTKWQDLVDFTIPKYSFIKGKKIENFIRKLVREKQFNDLEPKLTIVATRLKDGRETLFKDGDLTTAILASIAIPGVIPPKKIHNEEFVDGGLIDPLPIRPLKEVKCNICIGVDLSINYKEQKIRSTHVKEKSLLKKILRENFIKTELKFIKKKFKEKGIKGIPQKFVKVIDRLLTPKRISSFLSGKTPIGFTQNLIQSYTIMTNRLSQLSLINSKPTIIIKPQFRYLGWLEFDKAKEFIKVGEEATLRKIPEIKKLIKELS
jgi:predicted acylesterase/phospholipase RssA